MPYLQAGTANYFGFMPAEGYEARTRVYMVSSSEATTINPGDLVVYTTDKSTVRILSTNSDAALMVGIAASRVVAGDGSTGADFRTQTSQTCLVYDDPNTLFVGCDTTSGIGGTATFLGKSVQVCATGVTGSTGVSSLNRSVMAISAVTASSGSGASYKFDVIALHPCEISGYSGTAFGTAAATTHVRKWILKPAFHANVGFGLGYGHITT